MKTVLEEISVYLGDAFAAAGYDAALGKVSVSNRPDLCEFQCNGAMAGAKQYKKAPAVIANEVVAALPADNVFSKVEVVMPGFINLNVTAEYLCDYAKRMAAEKKYGCEPADPKKTVVLDYGGANVAKCLHIGHMRPAVIGEALKRLNIFFDNKVIGDAHLGDWGMPMGLVIEQIHDEFPDLCYFDPDYNGPYPEEVPFCVKDLEVYYPTASARSKEDEAFRERAHAATFRLQNGDPAYCALWKKLIDMSIADLKVGYANLNVSFDLWYGESNSQPYIEPMIADMKAKGLPYESEGALVMDVKEESDTKEIPPILLTKSDGAFLYATTDLATLAQREHDYHPDHIIYVVDKRQDMHFTQVFRCARKSGIIPETTKLTFIGNGTMNGADGKPFKTRTGGVMRLEQLVSEIREEVISKMKENHPDEPVDESVAEKIGIAALKYGDLSNQASKDYVFDIQRFSSFDGNTGPYILYTIVRIKSILQKYFDSADASDKTKVTAADRACDLLPPTDASERQLYLMLTRYNEFMQSAYEDLAPHRVCSFIFEVANRFNKFYHETHILNNEDAAVKRSYIAFILLAKEILEQAIWTLGFDAPERM
ncbi:MAG: arginine--tRNA ligase [Lachnospiraceae bacterium]|nr:arginine--tRNA ligase [Lachnospiraceae bacterium]